MTLAAQDYIRRETRIAGAINATLSALAYLVVFGRTDAVPVWGIGHYAFDFAPQSLMVALMSTLIPGVLATRNVRRGVVEAMPGRTRFPQSLLARSLLVGAVATMVFATLAVTLLAAIGIDHIDWAAGLLVKIVFGGLLGGTVASITIPASLMTR